MGFAAQSPGEMNGVCKTIGWSAAGAGEDISKEKDAPRLSLPKDVHTALVPIWFVCQYFKTGRQTFPESPGK